jgi:hypothetical protein
LQYKKANRDIRVDEEKSYVPLTQGLVSIIDTEDLPLIEGFTWYAANGYAKSRIVVEQVIKIVAMHRLITNATLGLEVDHINGNKLDNRKINLRLVTRQQNALNLSLAKNNKSGFKGVSWCNSSRKWKATIAYARQRYHLGFFNTPEAAYAAYRMASKRLHGEFGRVE